METVTVVYQKASASSKSKKSSSKSKKNYYSNASKGSKKSSKSSKSSKKASKPKSDKSINNKAYIEQSKKIFQKFFLDIDKFGFEEDPVTASSPTSVTSYSTIAAPNPTTESIVYRVPVLYSPSNASNETISGYNVNSTNSTQVNNETTKVKTNLRLPSPSPSLYSVSERPSLTQVELSLIQGPASSPISNPSNVVESPTKMVISGGVIAIIVAAVASVIMIAMLTLLTIKRKRSLREVSIPHAQLVEIEKSDTNDALTIDETFSDVTNLISSCSSNEVSVTETFSDANMLNKYIL